jgi:tetratricopeptide (TPR) repeat protein
MRAQTALTAYVGYLIKTVWPFGLALPYPRVRESALWATVACGLALAVVTVVVIGLARRGQRYMAVGWFWYLGMLAPVIGLITIGEQAMADRYTYLPLVGIFLAVVWGGADLLDTLARSPVGNVFRSVPGRWAGVGLSVACALLVLCAFRTFDQLRFWSDSETLFRHAIAVTQGNVLAHTNLGVALRNKGQHDEEIAEYREALRIQSNDYLSNANLGFSLSERGNLPEAVEHYRAALRSKPNDPLTLHNLGLAMAALGRASDAEYLFQESLRLDPDSALAEENRKTLAFAWLKEGRLRDAIGEFQEMLRQDPNESVALNSLAWLRATHPDAAIRNGPEAVTLAEKAVGRQAEDQSVLLDTLAAAYAEAGRYKEAVETAEKAQAVAMQRGNKELASSIAERRKLYQTGKPCRESPDGAKPEKP